MFESSRAVLTGKRKHLKSRGLGNRPNRAENLSEGMVEKLWNHNLLGGHDAKTLQKTIFLPPHLGSVFAMNHGNSNGAKLL